MSNKKKISQLTSATTLSGSEELPIVQGGVTVKVTAQNIADLAGNGTYFDLDSTITGTTHTLSHTPLTEANYYLNGQRCSIGTGKIIDSIVGTLVTFTDDQTGQIFTETYKY